MLIGKWLMGKWLFGKRFIGKWLIGSWLIGKWLIGKLRDEPGSEKCKRENPAKGAASCWLPSRNSIAWPNKKRQRSSGRGSNIEQARISKDGSQGNRLLELHPKVSGMFRRLPVILYAPASRSGTSSSERQLLLSPWPTRNSGMTPSSSPSTS